MNVYRDPKLVRETHDRMSDDMIVAPPPPLQNYTLIIKKRDGNETAETPATQEAYATLYRDYLAGVFLSFELWKKRK